MARNRRTNEQIFLDTLEKLASGESPLVGNIKLREHLSWDEGRYNRVKSRLVESNSIVLGRGHGGSVALAKGKKADKLNVFISYSHADEKYKEKLVSHLQPLKRLHLIDSWDDRKIKAGADWGDEISKKLVEADIILLLISIDFINSEYCYDIELERALERSEEGDAVVIPIILRSCLWRSAPFAKLQALPKDARAVASWPEEDEAFTNIADGIKQAAEKLIASSAD